MNTQEKSSDVKKSKKGLKVLIGTLAAAAGLVLVVVLLVPMYISSDGGKNMIVGKINESIDGKVEMQDLKMGWFSGVKLTDLKFADNAGTTSVNIKEITTKPKYVSLITGSVALGKTVIDKPQVEITVKKPQAMQSEKSTEDKTSETENKDDGFADGRFMLPDVELEVIDGNVKINLEDAEMMQSVELKNIASKIDLNPAGQTSMFDVALAVVGDEGESAIKASGKITPGKKGWTMLGADSDYTVKIDNLPLSQINPVLAMIGKDVNLSGNLNADAAAKIGGGQVKQITADAILTNFKSLTEGKEMVLTEPVTLKAKVSSSNNKPNIEQLDVASSFCKIKCSGKVESVDYTADVDITELAKFAGQFADLGKYDLKGKLLAEGNVAAADVIRADGKYDLTGFVLANREINKATSPTDVSVSGAVTFDNANKAVSFDGLNINSTPVTVSLSGAIGSANGNSKFTADAKADLAQVRPFLIVAGVMPEETVISGSAAAVVNVETENDDIHVTTNNTQVANLNISKAGQQQAFSEPKMSLAADVELNPKAKTYAVNKFSIDSTYIRLAKGQLVRSTKAGKTNLKGALEAEYDLEKVTQAASAFMPDNLNMKGKRSAVLNFDSSYQSQQKNGLMANMNAELAFGFDSAEYLGLEIGKADFDLKMNKGLLNIEPFSAAANNGKLNFGASINFNDENPALKIPKSMQIAENIEINDTLSSNFLQYLNPIFAGATNVRGIANLRCDELSVPIKASNVNDIAVNGTVGIDNLRMELNRQIPLGRLLYTVLPLIGKDTSNLGANMKLVNTDFTVKDSIVKYDNMQINVERYPLNFVGKIGIDTANPENGKDKIDMTLYLPVTPKGAITVDNVNAPGRFPIVMSGKTVKPEVDVERAKNEVIKALAVEKVGDLIDNALGGKKKSDDNSGGTVEDQLKEAGKEMLKDLFR